MSMAALRWARDARPDLGGPATAVLRDLADRASESGVCWPSVATICASTCMGRRTVQRALRSLENAGLITVKMTGRGSRYTLNLTPQSGLSDASEASQRRFRGAAVTPKASRSTQEAKRRTPSTDMKSAASAVDEAMLELARQWLKDHGE